MGGASDTARARTGPALAYCGGATGNVLVSYAAITPFVPGVQRRAFDQRAAVSIRTYRDRLGRECRSDGKSSDAHDNYFAMVHDAYLTPSTADSSPERRSAPATAGSSPDHRSAPATAGSSPDHRSAPSTAGSARIIGQRQRGGFDPDHRSAPSAAGSSPDLGQRQSAAGSTPGSSVSANPAGSRPDRRSAPAMVGSPRIIG